MNPLYRFRWWLVRKLAPKGVVCLRIRGDDNCRDSHAVRLSSSPCYEWGTGCRYATPRVQEILDRLQMRTEDLP